MSAHEDVDASATEAVTERILTIPNIISTIRLCLVPLYLILLFNGDDIAAAIIFAVAAATDFLDGQIARRTHTVSKVGKLLDPAVDTILMITGVLGVTILGRIPVWIAFLVFAREAFLLIGGAVLLKGFHIQIPVIYPGKVATTLLFIGFAGFILNLPQVPGLGLCDIPWLPGFDHGATAIWIWFLYVGLILQISVTVYYCVTAWRRLEQTRPERNR